MSDTELQDKLKLIQEAMEKAQDDPKKQEAYLMDIADPQDALNCEGCQ